MCRPEPEEEEASFSSSLLCVLFHPLAQTACAGALIGFGFLCKGNVKKRRYDYYYIDLSLPSFSLFVSLSLCVCDAYYSNRMKENKSPG